MKVCVVGLGYIGLPTATLAAIAGHQVIGVDVSSHIVETINGAKPHIQEPGLADLVKMAVLKGNLKAQQSPSDADVFMVSVPTPITEDKTADLAYVRQAALAVVPHIRHDSLFIIESTIPPGCTEEVVIPILEQSGLTAGVDFFVAHCPERVLPGNLMYELVHNDRVIGGVNPASAEAAKNFYATFVKGDIFTTGLKEAELCKLTENAYRDVNIAFANELSAICERLGIDVWEVIELARKHPRVNILNPGPGVGGHCIAVDPWFLVEACPAETRLIAAARQVNDDRPKRVVAQIEAEMQKLNVERPVIAALGLTYKADVGDMRCSPALEIVTMLKEKGYEVRACDPFAASEGKFGCVSVSKAVDGADALVLLVDHEEYLDLDVKALQSGMRNKAIFDTKGVWNDPAVESIKPLQMAEV